MKQFEVARETPTEPVGMKIVGVGVIASCLVLSTLFGWGIYLDLSREPCACECPVGDPPVGEGGAPAP